MKMIEFGTFFFLLLLPPFSLVLLSSFSWRGFQNFSVCECVLAEGFIGQGVVFIFFYLLFLQFFKQAFNAFLSTITSCPFCLAKPCALVEFFPLLGSLLDGSRSNAKDMCNIYFILPRLQSTYVYIHIYIYTHLYLSHGQIFLFLLLLAEICQGKGVGFIILFYFLIQLSCLNYLGTINAHLISITCHVLAIISCLQLDLKISTFPPFLTHLGRNF